VSPRARVIVCAVLFAALAAGLALRIHHAELRHRSEKRTVAIVTEMLASGAWLVPMHRGEPRLQKPPLYSWVVASSSSLAGGPSLVAMRAVSVVSGLALVALVFAWGFSLGGFGPALGSALALVAMGQFWSSATHATADILLALFGTAALFAFERGRLPALAILFVLAFLTKATAALVNVLVPAGVWLAATRELRRALEPRTLAWIALSTLFSVAWYAVVLMRVPDAPDLLGQFLLVPLGTGHNDLASDHYRPVYWYLPRFLGAAAPAILLLPFVVRDGVRTRFWSDAPRLRFLAASALALFIAWSIIPQKGRHYLLPILPLFALLCGDWLSRACARARPSA
jgi:4-amino-4-deoxy-L-arabinose transferase-like glycosyltransferase